MHDRFRFWWRALSRGTVSLNNAAGWFSLIVLLLGVASGIAVPVVFHVSHLLTALMLLACVLFVMLQGSYRVWAETEHRAQDAERDCAKAEAALKVEQSKPRQAGVVMNGGSNNTAKDNKTYFLSPPSSQT